MPAYKQPYTDTLQYVDEKADYKNYVNLCGGYRRYVKNTVSLHHSLEVNGELGSSGSFRDKFYGTPLNKKYETRNVDDIKKVDQTNIIIKAINDNVISGLHTSVFYWEKLLQQCPDANINAQGQMGFSLLHIVVRLKDSPELILEFIELLKNKNIDVSLKSKIGDTAATMATKSEKDVKIINALSFNKDVK